MNLHHRSFALVFGTAVISGVSIFINGLLVKTMTPSIFTFLKNSTVAVLVIAVLLGCGQWRELKTLKRKQWAQLVLIGLVGGSIPFFLFFTGLSMTSGTMGAFLHKTMFAYIAVFAALFLRERFHPTWFLGALCLLVGNAIFLKVDLSTFALPHLLILSATLFWAAENTLSKYTLRSVSGNVVVFGRMFFGVLFMMAYLLFTGEFFAIPTAFTSANIIAIGATAAFLLAYVLSWYNGIKHVPVSIATCVLLLGSPITTLLAAIFLDKTLSIPQMGGAGLLILGIACVLFSYVKTQRQVAFSTA